MDIESHVCTTPHLHPQLKESLVFTSGIFPYRAVSVTNHISWHSGHCLYSRSSLCLTPEAKVSRAIKYNTRLKLEAASSGSLDETKASLFPVWAIGSGTGMDRSGRESSSWIDSCPAGSTTHWLGVHLSIPLLLLLHGWTGFQNKEIVGEKIKGKKKKCFTWDFSSKKDVDVQPVLSKKANTELDKTLFQTPLKHQYNIKHAIYDTLWCFFLTWMDRSYT